MSSQQFFNRPPRLQPELPSREIEIPNPPDVATNMGWLSLVTVGLPLITILGYSFVASRGGRLIMLIPMAMAAVITSTVGFLTWRRNQQIQRTKQARYAERLTSLREEINEAHEQQQAFYKHNFPAVDTLLLMAQGHESRLWERRVDDADFGMARIGTGRLPSTVTFKPPNLNLADSPQLPAALKLAEDGAYVKDVALVLPLRHIHAVGIASRESRLTADFVRAMLVHLTALHSPNDLRLYIAGSPDTSAQWQWARWLPHCNMSRNNPGAGEQLCFDPQKIPAFWEKIQNDLESRQVRHQSNEETNTSWPFLVVVVDMTGSSFHEDMFAEGAVAALLNYGQELGASVMFLVPDESVVPSECRGIVTVEHTGQAAYFRYAEVGINAVRRNGLADRIDAARAEHEFSRHLAPIAVRTTYGADLPLSMTLLDLFGVNVIEELQISDRWRENLHPGLNWPKLALGRMAGNKLFELLFEQNLGSGVHGLVAGTTGTGKSQLLMTLIVSLTVCYDPSTVNFVLVDYKGGTAFEALRSLPHTVDVVTNLHGQAGIRAFTAIRAELNRRSALLTECRVQDIGQYHERGFHHEKPLSHLFIIIDEFAEMVKDRPEFKEQLDSIARLGRAVGAHLILATQRPSGVVSEQIRANMKFRICLRVETADDSRELLKRADATFLPTNIPGRAYVQIGNEELNLIQVAQVGNIYEGPHVDTQPAVVWLKNQQQTEVITTRPPGAQAETLLEVIVRYMRQLMVENDDFRRPQKPWPDPLPEYLPLSDLNPSVADWLDGQGAWRGIDWSRQAMRCVIGLLDNPAAANQSPLTLDLTRGHAVVFGVSGWGKTGLLRTIITSLTATHSPAELHIYFLDFGGRGLDMFQSLPHLGASITPPEGERVSRLLRKLDNTIEERKTLFSQAQVSTLNEYNAQHPDRILPAILFVLDNFAEFRELFPELMETGFTSLARDGRAYGIHILVSAEQISAIPPKIYSMFSERFALRLADVTEYSVIVGRGVTELTNIPGRGFVRPDRVPLEFQVALPVGSRARKELDSEGREISSDDTGDNVKLAHLAAQMHKNWSGEMPERISVLNPIIALKNLLDHAAQSQVLLGLVDLDLSPAFIDLKSRGPHFTIVGPPLSGRTTVLRTWILSQSMNCSPEQVSFVLVDFHRRLFQYGGQRQLGELPHVLATVTDLPQLEQIVVQIQNEFENRHAENRTGADTIVIIDNYDDFASVANTNRAIYGKLAGLARTYSVEGLHFIAAGAISSVQTNDEFMRQVIAPRYGLGLDASDSIIALGGRIRRGAAVEFPPGRGYIVKSGLVSLIQVATPQNENSDMESSLDYWVEQVNQKYPNRANE